MFTKTVSYNQKNPLKRNIISRGESVHTEWYVLYSLLKGELTFCEGFKKSLLGTDKQSWFQYLSAYFSLKLFLLNCSTAHGKFILAFFKNTQPADLITPIISSAFTLATIPHQYFTLFCNKQ